MAQADYVVANGTGAAVRSDLNGQLAAIVSNNSGATEPATMYAYQWWADTTAGLLKLRNSANSAWITMRQLDGEFSTVPVENGTAAAPSIYFKDSGTDSGFFSPGTDAVAISTAGTNRLHITSGGLVGIGSPGPTKALEVAAGATSGNGILVTGSSSPQILLTANSSVSLSMQTDGAAGYLGTATNHPLILRTNNTERAQIDTSGRLLVGTSSTSADTRAIIQGRSSAGDSTGRLHISSGNDTPGDGDGIAELHFTSSGHVASGRIAAQRDGGTWTAGSSLPTRLVFSTTADSASSPTERLRINSSGAILYGTTTKNITSPNNPGFEILSQTTGGLGLYSNTTGDNITSVVFQNPNGRVGFIDINANSVVYSTSSDYRLKENVTAITDGITRLQQLKPTRFNFITNPDQTVDGFLAHEVQAIVPEAITGEKDAVDEEGNPVCQGIDQSKLVPLLTAALQEAIGRIETLEAEVSTLKGA